MDVAQGRACGRLGSMSDTVHTQREPMTEEEHEAAGSQPQLFTVALYDEDGRCKVDNHVTYTREAAEEKALAWYKNLYPGRTYRVGE